MPILSGGIFLKKKQQRGTKREKVDDITEEDVKVPLHTLVIDRRTRVNIGNMADYSDVFAAIEGTVLAFWQEATRIRDKDVLSAYTALLKDFDHQPEGSLASEIAKCVKANLLSRRQEKLKDYTYGEITSCLTKLITIAKDHRSPDGIGYLKWVKTFFEGDMPMDIGSILEYMFTNEM
jgi:hypothetical protein